MNRNIALVIAKTAFGGSLALGGFMAAPHGTAHADVAGDCTATDAYAREVGDDNCDGIVMEDERGWQCDRMGNFICGPLAYDAGAYVGGYN